MQLKSMFTLNLIYINGYFGVGFKNRMASQFYVFRVGKALIRFYLNQNYKEKRHESVQLTLKINLLTINLNFHKKN